MLLKLSFLWIASIVLLEICQGQTNLNKLEQSSLYFDSLQYEKAIELAFEVVEEAENQKNKRLLAKAYLRLGTIYCSIEKADIGLKYYHRSLSCAVNAQDSLLIGNAYFGLAGGHQYAESYDSSLFFYGMAIPFIRRTSSDESVSYIHSNLGLLYSKIQNYDSANFYFGLAIDYQARVRDYYGLAASYLNLGLLEFESSNYKLALKYYKQSSQYYKKASDEKGFSEAQRWLALSFYNLDMMDSAGRYYFVYDSLGHNYFHKDYEDKILELETKYKTAEIERDNALQRAQLEEKQNQLAILIFAVLVLGLVSISGYYIINLRRRRTKTIADQKIQDLLQTQEVKTAYALLEGQDQERKRIATELHDNLGSTLVTLNMFSDSLAAKIDDPQTRELVEKIGNTTKHANETVRQISHSLDSGLLRHFGLKAAITQLAEAVQSAKPIKVETLLEIEDSFDNEIGLEIYRMVQELFNNALKHSESTKIRLELNQIQNSINLIFEDNGKGFQEDEITRGMGLSNLEIRAEKLGGELKIDSRPGVGSTFIIDIPEL